MFYRQEVHLFQVWGGSTVAKGKLAPVRCMVAVYSKTEQPMEVERKQRLIKKSLTQGRGCSFADEQFNVLLGINNMDVIWCFESNLSGIRTKRHSHQWNVNMINKWNVRSVALDSQPAETSMNVWLAQHWQQQHNTTLWSATGCQARHTYRKLVIIESKPQGQMAPYTLPCLLHSSFSIQFINVFFL